MSRQESCQANQPLFNVDFIERRSSVLSSSGLACLSDIPTINLTAGCVHGCTYCYIQGYRNYPGRNNVVIYRNTATLLKRELERRRSKPSAVYFSPSSDLFQPIKAMSELSLSVLEILFQHNVGVVFLTKGTIPDAHQSLLRDHRHLVRAQVGITTLDESIAAAFEPWAATARDRINQIAWLIANEIKTLVRMDPILPGLGDDVQSLEALIQQLAAVGVTKLSASVLFLRASLLRHLKANTPHDQIASLLDRYKQSDRVGIRAGQSSVWALPQQERQVILNRVKEIASDYGITVMVCACKNPDLAKGTCGIAGNWAGPFHNQAAASLFECVE